MAQSTRCLVFGGSGALGGDVCRVLAGSGARVAFTWNKGEEAAGRLSKDLPEAHAMRADLLDVSEVERVVDEAAALLGGIDAFVQCAGVAITVECAGPTAHHRMPAIGPAEWDRMMDVNVKSTFFACRRVIEIMRKGGGGNIVLTGSIDGVKPAPAPVHYAASKGALAGMTQAMAKEIGEFGIRVNMVAPGIMEAGLSRSLPANLLQEYVKHCGLRRVGRLREIANVIAWLARENTYVTGQTILVDGAL